MTTFTCGVEQPIQANEQLYSLDEGTGSIGLAQFTNANLHRYSFVPQVESSSGADLLAVVARIASAFGGLVTWVVTFLESPAVSPLRSRALVKRLSMQEWNTVKGSGLYLATKPVSFDSERSLPPEDADPRICGWTILLGHPPDYRCLVERPFKATLSTMALTHRFQPSQEFLAACGEAQLAVAYVAKDSRERMGLVVVSPRELSLVIRGMQRDGLVGRVLLGDDANEVWRT